MKMKDEDVRERMLRAAVKNMREFGYEHVKKPEDVMAGYPECLLFKSMLEDHANMRLGSQIERVRDRLLSEVDAFIQGYRKSRGKKKST